MNIQEFLDKAPDEAKLVFKTLNELILKHDTSVSVEVGSIMSVKEALVYKQNNVFKYGLTITKNHFSLHSMVMYAYPEVVDVLKKNSKGIKFQKGCMNFKSLDNIDLSSFEEFIKISARKDFSPIIKHYTKRKK